MAVVHLALKKAKRTEKDLSACPLKEGGRGIPLNYSTNVEYRRVAQQQRK